MAAANSSTMLTLYYDGRGPIRVKFFPTSPRAELIECIREVLGVAATAPLRFRDEEGDIVLVVPSMPPATLHVRVEAGFPSGAAAAAPAPAAASPLRFALHTAGTTLGEGGATFATSADGTRPWWALTDALPAAGKHYFTLRVKDRDSARRPCCASVGFVDASIAALPASVARGAAGEGEWLVSLQGVGLGDREASSTMGGTDELLGVAYDADARTALLTLHGCPTKGPLALVGLPARPRFAVHGRKHCADVELRACAPPGAAAGAAEEEEEEEDEEEDEDEDEEPPSTIALTWKRRYSSEPHIAAECDEADCPGRTCQYNALCASCDEVLAAGGPGIYCLERESREITVCGDCFECIRAEMAEEGGWAVDGEDFEDFEAAEEEEEEEEEEEARPLA